MFVKLTRLFTIFGCLALSIIVIHKTKAPSRLHMHGFKVACIPLTSNMAEADEMLRPYYHVYHDTLESKSSKVPSYRCYFRFTPSDIACMPIDVANRRGNLAKCPCYITSPKKACYFLNDKYKELLNLLKLKPAVDHERYKASVVQTWQEVRDVLIGKKTIEFAMPDKKLLKKKKQ